MTLSVGQALWYVPSEGIGGPREVTITKIGRKWAQLSGNHGRMDIKSYWIDGGQDTSPGRCWISKEVYEAELSRQKAWIVLYEMVWPKYRAPDGISTDAINSMIELLSRMKAEAA